MFIDCSSGGITDSRRILGKEIKFSYQVRCGYVKRNGIFIDMAVGLIIHGDQAEQICAMQADLLASRARNSNNPKAMDASMKLGGEGRPHVPPQSAPGSAPRKRGLGPQPSKWTDRARWHPVVASTAKQSS